MSAKAHVDIPALELMDVELPGVVGGGMSGRNEAAKARNHSRVAEALPQR